MKVYFAGPPCTPGDWRHELIPNLHLDPKYFQADPDAPWPTRSKALRYNKSAYADYVGPYSMQHMPQSVLERGDLLQALAIAQADVVFAWLGPWGASSPTLAPCHWVAYEIGYAAGLKKHIVAGLQDESRFPRELPTRVFDEMYQGLLEGTLAEALRTYGRSIRDGEEGEPDRGRAIHAKFDSKCGHCGGKIVAGSLIIWARGKPGQHLECYATKMPVSPVVFTESVQAEVLNALQRDNNRLRDELTALIMSSKVKGEEPEE